MVKKYKIVLCQFFSPRKEKDKMELRERMKSRPKRWPRLRIALVIMILFILFVHFLWDRTENAWLTAFLSWALPAVATFIFLIFKTLSSFSSKTFFEHPRYNIRNLVNSLPLLLLPSILWPILLVLVLWLDW